MRRADLQRLSQVRLLDAESLLHDDRYAACYYLLGYVVECAIKACIAKQFRRSDIPDPKMVTRIYRHELEDLVGLAGLKQDLDQLRARDMQFEAKWNVVKDWNPNVRYETRVSRQDAQDPYDAIADVDHGVLQWLQRHW